MTDVHAGLDDVRDAALSCLTGDAGTIRALWHDLGAHGPKLENGAGPWVDCFGPAALGEGGRRASFGVNLEHGGYSDKGGGGASGDVLGAVQRVHGLTFPSAVVWLADFVNVPVPDAVRRYADGGPSVTARPGRREQARRVRDRTRERARPDVPPYAPGAADQPVPLTAFRAMIDALDGDDPAAVALRRYLDGRGLTPDVRAAIPLGMLGPLATPPAGLRFLRHVWRGPWLVVVGRIRPDDDPTTGGGFVTNGQAFPFDPAAGGWATDADGERIRARSFGPVCLYPDPATAPAPSEDRPGVVLCEGPWDTLTARAAGFDAFGVPGVSNVSPAMLGALAARPYARAAGLCLAFDGDAAGRAGAARAAGFVRELPALSEAFGGRVVVAPVPDGADVNDLARAGDLDAVRETIHAARRIPDPAPGASGTAPENRADDPEKGFPIPDSLRGGEDRERDAGGGLPLGYAPLWGFSDPPPRRWIVPGLMPEGHSSIIAGDGGTGKSFLAANLAVCLVLGRDWLGHPTGAPRPVIYADFELDADEQKRRFVAVLSGLNLTPHSPGLAGRLHYYRPAGTLATGAAHELADLVAALGGDPRTVVILDSLTVALGGDASAQADVTDTMNSLRACGTVVALDHVSSANRNASVKQMTPFGSVMKRNLARASFSLAKATEDGGALVLRMDKNNFGPAARDLVTYAMDFDGADGLSVRFRRIGSDAPEMEGAEQHMTAAQLTAHAVRVIYAGNPAAFRSSGVNADDVLAWRTANAAEAGGRPVTLKTVQNHLSGLVRGNGAPLKNHADGVGYLPADADPWRDGETPGERERHAAIPGRGPAEELPKVLPAPSLPLRESGIGNAFSDPSAPVSPAAPGGSGTASGTGGDGWGDGRREAPAAVPSFPAEPPALVIPDGWSEEADDALDVEDLAAILDAEDDREDAQAAAVDDLDTLTPETKEAYHAQAAHRRAVTAYRRERRGIPAPALSPPEGGEAAGGIPPDS